MATSFHVLVFTIIIISSNIPTYFSYSSLTRGSSLSVENKDDLLNSPNGLFVAGFHQVGENAYNFAVWFSDKTTLQSRTVVWMANRDAPVNGKQSKLSLSEDGNLVLIDAGRYVIWSTNTRSTTSLLQLKLHNTGNLVLHEGTQPIWQSFDHPTDTLLPNQPFTKNTQLISSRSSTNFSSGFYKLFFNNDSILRLLYDGLETTTVYWPHPSLRTWEVGRMQYIYTRRAVLDSNGEFISSDGFRFKSADFGFGPQRIMKIDTDGNLRVYSLVERDRLIKWEVQWQAVPHSCTVHGTCGPNSLCSYSHNSGRKCTCLHGYKMVNSHDWSYGCEPEFEPCNTQDDCDFGFIEIRHADFYGYDSRLLPNYTLNGCKDYCLQDTSCKGFQFGWLVEKGFYYCFIKNSLYNGIQLGFSYPMYIKLPKRLVSSFYQKPVGTSSFSCPSRPVLMPVARFYDAKHDMKLLGYMLLFGCTIGFIEITCILFIWIYGSRSHSSTTYQDYFPTGFRKFTYRELKKASCNFREEIGRGGACIVYKGTLTNNTIVAIKMLIKNTNHQGEDEFQAEISMIGRVNHMNLVEMLGYCSERKHRLIVYEYVENGSLAKNLGGLGKLDWATRFDIAKGTAKGLAYLHEECLEWVLHCDVKPHNILLDANYTPKVADFGLSRLFDRNGIDELNFSMIRGTRGYMAPEWVLNLPITSKVDVYSYGVVILEMITGRSPTCMHQIISDENGETKLGLIEWVRFKMKSGTESWVEEIIDPSISRVYDRIQMDKLISVAMQCVEEDREARPSMSEVVTLLHL